MARAVEVAIASQVPSAQIVLHGPDIRLAQKQRIKAHPVPVGHQVVAVFPHALRSVSIPANLVGVAPLRRPRHAHRVRRHFPAAHTPQLHALRHRCSPGALLPNQALQPTRIPWLRHSMRAAELGRCA